MVYEPHDVKGHDGSENPRNDQSVEIDLSTADATSPLKEKPLRREIDSYTFDIARLFMVIFGIVLLIGLMPLRDNFLNYTKAIVPLFSPFLGVILGYYFGTRVKDSGVKEAASIRVGHTTKRKRRVK